MLVVHENVLGHCPGGFCEYLLQFSEVLGVLLVADGFIFLVTLLPPLFTWKNKKPDSKKRVFFAVFACLTFYFWLAILAINSLYCFGFLAYAGPCNASAPLPAKVSPVVSDSFLGEILLKSRTFGVSGFTEQGFNLIQKHLFNALKIFIVFKAIGLTKWEQSSVILRPNLSAPSNALVSG